MATFDFSRLDVTQYDIKDADHAKRYEQMLRDFMHVVKTNPSCFADHIQDVDKFIDAIRAPEAWHLACTVLPELRHDQSHITSRNPVLYRIRQGTKDLRPTGVVSDQQTMLDEYAEKDSFLKELYGIVTGGRARAELSPKEKEEADREIAKIMEESGYKLRKIDGEPSPEVSLFATTEQELRARLEDRMRKLDVQVVKESKTLTNIEAQLKEQSNGITIVGSMIKEQSNGITIIGSMIKEQSNRMTNIGSMFKTQSEGMSMISSTIGEQSIVMTDICLVLKDQSEAIRDIGTILMEQSIRQKSMETVLAGITEGQMTDKNFARTSSLTRNETIGRSDRESDHDDALAGVLLISVMLITMLLCWAADYLSR